MREWVKEHPVSEKRLQPGSVVKAILDKKATHDVSFEIHPDANPPSRKQGLLRWQINPEPNWGPKPKAKIFNENQLESKSKTIKVNKRKHEKVNTSTLMIIQIVLCLSFCTKKSRALKRT